MRTSEKGTVLEKQSEKETHSEEERTEDETYLRTAEFQWITNVGVFFFFRHILSHPSLPVQKQTPLDRVCETD